MEEERVRRHFADQAAACDTLGSPFTAHLCRALSSGLDRTTQTGQRVLDWAGDPRADALSLRLCGGLHGLVISGADAALSAVYPPHPSTGDELALALPAALRRNDASLLACLDSAPQTNEISRSAILLSGFLEIARTVGMPLNLFELGSSAGLNLLFDRFHYNFGDQQWGDAASPVRLQPEMRGGLPVLSGDLQIGSRTGCDIAPINLEDAAHRLRLKSYVWADQEARMARLGSAIELAASADFVVKKADAAAFVRSSLERRPTGRAVVVFHSIVWQYLPEAIKAGITEAMVDAGASASSDAPLAWLRMEPLDTRDAFATLTLTLWPGGETRHLARCDYHGRWLDWIGA